MTPPVINSGIAHWFADRRRQVWITTEEGDLLDWYGVPLPRDRPGLETLWGTGWHAYPGSGWAEKPPGHWTQAVFRHGIHLAGM
jgi:hypothetical protein